MNPLDVLNTIRRTGGRAVVLDGEVQVIAPPGTLNPEQIDVLRQHRDSLVKVLPSAEREAVVWAETLDDLQAATLVGTDDVFRRVFGEPVVVGVEISGDELRLTAPTPEIAAKIEAGRQRIEQALSEDQDDQDENLVVEAGAPCSFCGSLMAWWDCGGGIHCMDCDPPLRSQRLQAQAARLRRIGERRTA